MNAWFEGLGRRFKEAARKEGVEIAQPELDAQTTDEVLELARVAAHPKERRFAPLACFMAGVAAEWPRHPGSPTPLAQPAYSRADWQPVEAESIAAGEQ